MNKKIKLDLDSLRIQSFETTDASAAGPTKGTVVGQSTVYPTGNTICDPNVYTCGAQDTCFFTDISTCNTDDYTCFGDSNIVNCGGNWSCDTGTSTCDASTCPAWTSCC